MLKMPTAVTALFVAGLMGPACSSSGLKTIARDAGAASGGQGAAPSGAEPQEVLVARMVRAELEVAA
jgi:hypothetical protein